MGLSAVLAIIENLLNLEIEQPRQLEGKRQGRVVFAGLDGVYSLARDADLLAKLRLAPAMLGTKDAKPIVHGRSSSATSATGPA
jgi:hypothetical protein